MKTPGVFIGLLKAWVEIPGCGSLKQKRGAIRPLLIRIRDKFGVAASEVGYHDVWNRCAFAVAAVGNDGPELLAFLQSVVAAVERHHETKLLDYKTELIPAGGVELRPELRPELDEELRSVEAAWVREDEPGDGSAER